jgi:hypothetical protein
VLEFYIGRVTDDAIEAGVLLLEDFRKGIFPIEGVDTLSFLLSE